MLCPDSDGTGSLRRAMCEVAASSLLAFARLYLAPRFSLPWNAMHRAVASDLAPHHESPRRLVVGAPDGYGKTSLISFAYPLWLLAHRRARFIVLAASTRAAAGELLREIDSQLRQNRTLCRHYPHLGRYGRSSGASGSRASPPRDLVWPGQARITTASLTAGIAQMSHEGRPPDVVIFDEPEPWTGRDREDIDVDARSGPGHVVRHALSSRLPRASFIVQGAASSAGGVIDRLLAKGAGAEWTQRFFPAIARYPDHFEKWFAWEAIHAGRIQFEGDTGVAAAQRYLREHQDALCAGARLLWPERESLQELMRLRAIHGWAWFDRHRQGNPPGGCERTGSRHSVTLSMDEEDQSWLIDDAGFRRRVDRDRLHGPWVTMALDDAGPPSRPLPDAAGPGPAAF